MNFNYFHFWKRLCAFLSFIKLETRNQLIMLLTIDIGNSNIVLGIYKKELLLFCWRMVTELNRTSDEYLLFFKGMFAENNINYDLIVDTIISSVVPPINPLIQSVIMRLTGSEPSFVSHDLLIGYNILVDHPGEVGADRLVNAIAGFDKFKASVIIVDFGTATTFDVISKNGAYLGGIIAPGLHIALDALCAKTSKLPKVEIEKPRSYIGKNTIHSMQSGIYFGYVGMIDSFIENIRSELNHTTRVIATGGLAKVIQKSTKHIEIVLDDLTLWGLKLIYEKYFSRNKIA